MKLTEKGKMQKRLLIILYALFLLWGLCVYKDYGISYDEPIQRNHGLVNLKYVYKLVNNGADLQEMPEGVSGDLQEYAARYYGIGIKIPLLLAEYLNGFKMTKQQIYHMHHIYTFLLFFTASVFVYKIVRKLGLEYIYSVIAVILFMICPRILADAFYNMKDSAFLSLFVMMLYFGLSWLDENRIKYAAGLAVTAAFCLNTRIVGALPLLILCIAYVFQNGKKECFKKLLQILTTGAISFMIYLLITPASWENPLNYIDNVVHTFSNYDHIQLLGLGNAVYNNDQLPWYYTIVCICLTMPNLYLFFGIAGIIAGKKECRKNLLVSVIYAQFFCIILYDAVLRPVKYNMWRHFYFVFIYIVIFAAMGIRYVFKKMDKYRNIAAVCIGMSLAFTIVWILKNHPYEYLYFNPLYAINEAEVTERDYWHVSGQNLLEAIENDENINVCAQDIHKMFFGEKGWEYYHENRDTYCAEYFIKFWDMKKSSNICYKEIENVTVNGRKSSSLMKRLNYDNCLLKYFISDTGTVTGNNNKQEMQWDYMDEEGERCLKAYIPKDYKITQIDFLASEKSVISNVRAYSSDDGEHWLPCSSRKELFVSDDIYSVLPENALPQYFMLKYCAEQNVDFAVRAYGGQSSDISYVESEYGTGELKYLFDGDINTRWTSFEPQKAGMYIEFGLNRVRKICGISLKKGDSSNDYSRKLEIQYQTSNGSFETVPYSTDDDVFYEFTEPVSCSVLRLVNQDSQDIWYWSVHEIEPVFEDNCFWSYADTKNAVENLSASEAGENIWNAIDHNVWSVWTTEQTQNEDMYIDLKIKPSGVVSGFYIDNGNCLEIARGMKIYGSYDENQWDEIKYEYSSAYEYVFERAHDYRYYRIRQTEKDAKYPWSVAEIGLLRTNQ